MNNFNYSHNLLNHNNIIDHIKDLKFFQIIIKMIQLMILIRNYHLNNYYKKKNNIRMMRKKIENKEHFVDCVIEKKKREI